MKMTDTDTGVRVAEVIERYGQCLELVSVDPHFHDISVGLYVKGAITTVWTFSREPGVERRVRRIRDQLVSLGGLAPVEGTQHQVVFPCDHFHVRAMKFLLAQAVEKDPSYRLPEGAISLKDTKSALVLSVTGREVDKGWIYTVTGEGEAPNVPLRLAAVVRGFLRYGEMRKVSDTEVTFPCSHRHDELIRLLLPYARNISAVEDSLQATALRGQLTTGTAGFTPL